MGYPVNCFEKVFISIFKHKIRKIAYIKPLKTREELILMSSRM